MQTMPPWKEGSSEQELLSQGVTSMAIAKRPRNLHWFRVPAGNGCVSFHSTISCHAVTHLPCCGNEQKIYTPTAFKAIKCHTEFFSNNHLHLICVYWNEREEEENAPVFICLMISWWFCQTCCQLVISFAVKESVFSTEFHWVKCMFWLSVGNSLLKLCTEGIKNLQSKRIKLLRTQFSAILC